MGRDTPYGVRDLQVLRYDDERHWLRAAPTLAGHLFPRLLGQPEYNARLKAAAPLMTPRCAGRRDARDRGTAAADGRHPSAVRAVHHHRPARAMNQRSA